MFDRIELNPEQVPLYKLILHSIQIVLVFVIWCLEIAVFRGEDSTINGNNGWVFGLCFLCIPAWIYLGMAPRFPRTRKFAEPRIMAIIDGLFVIFWLSALAAQAAFNSAGSCGKVCSLSKAIVGLSFFVMLFFGLSTFVSIFTVKYYQWNNGRLPGYDKVPLGGQNLDPDKDAFSTAPHDEEAHYSTLNANDHEDDHHTEPSVYDGNYASMNSRYGNQTDDGYGGAGRSDLSYGTDMDTEYRPHTAATSSLSGRPYNTPSAVDAYDDDRPAQFPAGNYHQ